MNKRIIIKNARLSFPALAEKAKFDGKETKFEATLLIDKGDSSSIEAIKSDAKTLMEAQKIKKIPVEKWCIKDGDDSEYEGCAGNHCLKVTNKRQPQLFDRAKNKINGEDAELIENTFYAGCRVNASVSIWVQNNQFGKRVNCQLHAIQFFANDDAFGSGVVDASDDFEALDELPKEDANDDIPF